MPLLRQHARRERGDEQALQFTHSGSRYLLGYGESFFGIWDRQGAGGPVSRFPRTDEGWREAWTAFGAMEPDSAEVGISSSVACQSLPLWWATGRANRSTRERETHQAQGLRLLGSRWDGWGSHCGS